LVAEWRFCPDCGQVASTPRLTLHEIGHETLHALWHVDRSALSLIRALAVRPGRVALEYVSGRRKRYYGPFAFLLVTVAVAAAAIALTNFPAVTSDVPNGVANFLQHHVNLIFLLQVPLLAARAGGQRGVSGAPAGSAPVPRIFPHAIPARFPMALRPQRDRGLGNRLCAHPGARVCGQ
jgi:Protein of unknown function (DUF3667)